MKRVVLMMASALMAFPAMAGEGYGGGGSTAIAGAAAFSKSSARASSASFAAGGNARAYGGNAAAYGGRGGAGGTSTVVNSVDTGNRGSWWQGQGATVIPPAMASNGTCADSVSFGASFGPGGLSFGVPARNKDCNIREYAKTYLMIGQAHRSRAQAAAWRVMCLAPEAQEAGICK